MESELLLNRTGALHFCTLYYVYRKEGIRFPFLIGTWT
jgi:hypothetical protein